MFKSLEEGSNLQKRVSHIYTLKLSYRSFLKKKKKVSINFIYIYKELQMINEYGTFFFFETGNEYEKC